MKGNPPGLPFSIAGTRTREVHITVFIGGAILMMALVTIGLQSVRAALMNPVKSPGG